MASIGSIHPSPVYEVEVIHSVLKSRNIASEEHTSNSGSLKRYVRQFGEDAFLYIALILLEENYEEAGLYLLEEQIRIGPSWIREAAVLELIKFYQKERIYKEVIELSRVFNNKFSDSPLKEEVSWQRNQALYWSEKYSEVFRELGNSIDKEVTAEMILFLAVSKNKLEKKDWENDFLNLAKNYPASNEHERAYAYLNNNFNNNKLSGLIDLMEAKSHLAGGNHRSGYPILINYVKKNPLEISSVIVKELGVSFRRSGQSVEKIKDLISLLAIVSGDVEPLLREQLVRIYRAAGLYQEAISHLNELLNRDVEPELEDRYRWLLFDIKVNRMHTKTSSERLNVFLKHISQWHKEEYFTDLLEPEISRLLARQAWQDLSKIHESLISINQSSRLAARTAFLLARANHYGLFKGSKDYSKEDLLKSASLADPIGYYGSLSAVLLGKRPEIIRIAAESSENLLLEKTLIQKIGNDQERYVDGFLRFGLIDRALVELEKQQEYMTDWILRRTIKKLEQPEFFRTSLNLSVKLFRKYIPDIEIGDFYSTYPQNYYDLIKNIDLEKVPLSVFYALVREESYFDSKIVSHAGAIGLTQLMPTTAADEAQRMKIETPYDLNDPATNLLIGSHHLTRVAQRLDQNITKALLAYNAGLSRVRNWDRSFQELPLELYVEAVPFPETRKYIKKIFISALMYGHLYERKTSLESTGVFFPNLSAN